MPLHSQLWIGVLLPMLLFLGGCRDAPPGGSANSAPHGLDPVRIARGSEIYRQNCAACHGERAQGAFGWERPGADGKYPAPPLDGSAHAWHHPYTQLKQTIQEGTLKLGGSMPAWKGKLTDSDTDAVIAYFQSLWSAEIYQAWADIDRRSRMEAAK